MITHTSCLIIIARHWAWMRLSLWLQAPKSVLLFSYFSDSTLKAEKCKPWNKCCLHPNSLSIPSIPYCNTVFLPYTFPSVSLPLSHIALFCAHTFNSNRGIVMQYWWKCGVVTGRSGWSLRATRYSYSGVIFVWWLWLIAAVAHTLICGERDVAERQDFDDEVTHGCLLLLVIHGVCHAENKETNTEISRHTFTMRYMFIWVGFFFNPITPIWLLTIHMYQLVLFYYTTTTS